MEEGDAFDPCPGVELLGKGVFCLPGSMKQIFINPEDNYCSLDGKCQRSKWCEHLISAGLRLDPPIIVNVRKPKRASLTKLDKYQRDLKRNELHNFFIHSMNLA